MRGRQLISSSDRTQDVRLMRVNEHGGTLHSESLGQMAEKFNVFQLAYASFEKGGNLRVGTLQKIASAMGSSLSIEMPIKEQHVSLTLKI